MAETLVSSGDVVIAANEPVYALPGGAPVFDDSAGDIVFRTGGAERARIKADGSGSGWASVLGSGFSLADYIIYADGLGNIIGQPLTSGLPVQTGSAGNSDAVFQACINALKPIGGKIGFKGLHTFINGITTYSGIGIIGEGPLSQGTQTPSLITATSAVTGPIITCGFDSGGTGWQSFPYFSGFALKGSGAGNTGQDGIFCNDANVLDVILDDILMFDIGGNGWHQGSSATGIKTWIRNCYFERCRQNGVRNEKGTCQVYGCYIQNNTLFGIDATSSSYLEAFGNYIWQNAGGGVQLWSMTSGATVHDNNFNNNGDNTHPVIVLKSLTTATTRAVVHDNVMIDTRASGSACNFFIQATLGVNANVQNNTMTGQKSGNDAINVATHASNNLTIAQNAGYNGTKGSITNPIDTTNNRLGVAGNTATAVASTDYVVSEVEQYLVVTGGTGVSISIKDPAGNTVRSGLTTLAERIPLGFKINLGAFSVAPTVASYLV